MDNERLNEKRYNNFGSEMIIVAYRSYKDIDVYFPKYDYIVKNTRYDAFKNGELRCNYEPRVHNIGFLGYGKYIPISNHKKCHKVWASIFERCYSEKYQIKKESYVGCEICKEWHDFQNFAEWYYDNYYEIDNEVMALDKDILHKGNKIYSPNNCVFVPQRINSLFTKSDAIRGEYPIGVNYNKRNDKLIVKCQTLKGRKHLGYFQPNQVEEAFQCYKNFKESYIKQVADEYKDKIPYKLYKSMYEYEVDIND